MRVHMGVPAPPGLTPVAAMGIPAPTFYVAETYGTYTSRAMLTSTYTAPAEAAGQVCLPSPCSALEDQHAAKLAHGMPAQGMPFQGLGPESAAGLSPLAPGSLSPASLAPVPAAVLTPAATPMAPCVFAGPSSLPDQHHMLTPLPSLTSTAPPGLSQWQGQGKGYAAAGGQHSGAYAAAGNVEQAQPAFQAWPAQHVSLIPCGQHIAAGPPDPGPSSQPLQQDQQPRSSESQHCLSASQGNQLATGLASIGGQGASQSASLINGVACESRNGGSRAAGAPVESIEADLKCQQAAGPLQVSCTQSVADAAHDRSSSSSRMHAPPTGSSTNGGQSTQGSTAHT